MTSKSLAAPRNRLRGRCEVFLGILALTLLTACAPDRKLIYSPDEIRDELRSHRVEAASDITIPFEISPELKQVARQRVEERSPGQAPIDALIETVFDVEHDYDVTATGDEIFQQQRGDCISATSLFVGLARAAGLRAYFVEALGVEEVSAHETLNVRHRHVLAGYGPSVDATLVDFGRVDRDYVRFRVISDLEAVARYYNTKGYQALREDDLQTALRAFDVAVGLGPDLAWIHNSRGVALRRLGRLHEAERSLRRALELDPSYATAHLNLSLLLQLTGRAEAAQHHRLRAEELRSRDPLRPFHEARRLVEDGRFEEAVEPLERALRRAPRFLAAWRELGRVHLQLGEDADARKAVERVLSIAPEDSSGQLMQAILEGALPREALIERWPPERIRKPEIPALRSEAEASGLPG